MADRECGVLYLCLRILSIDKRKEKKKKIQQTLDKIEENKNGSRQENIKTISKMYSNTLYVMYIISFRTALILRNVH